MLPVLVQLGPVRLYAMGVFLLMAILAGMYWWWKMGRDEHWDEIELFDMYFLSLFSFFLFGRGVYLLLNWHQLGSIWAALSILRNPGVNYLGGIVGAWLVATLYSRGREWSTAKVWDSLAVVTGLCLFIGSVGTLLNQGRLWLDSWGIAWAGATFVVVSLVRKNFRFYEWYKGQASVAKDGLVVLVLLVMAGLYYLVRGLITGTLFESVIGFVIAVTALVLIVKRSGKENQRWREKLKYLLKLSTKRRKK